MTGVTAWPFLISRSQVFDYRGILVPVSLSSDDFDNVLSAVETRPTNPEGVGDLLSRRQQIDTSRGPMTVYYRSRASRSGEGDRLDSVARPIMRVEGVVCLGKVGIGSIPKELTELAATAIESAHDASLQWVGYDGPILAEQLGLEERREAPKIHHPAKSDDRHRERPSRVIIIAGLSMIVGIAGAKALHQNQMAELQRQFDTQTHQLEQLVSENLGLRENLDLRENLEKRHSATDRRESTWNGRHGYRHP